METSRNFLCHELYGGSDLICKCCGNKIDINLYMTNSHTIDTRYECKCKAWNDIINTKNEIEELNREFDKQYKIYEKSVREKIRNLYSDYGIKLQDEIWLKEVKSVKGKIIK